MGTLLKLPEIKPATDSASHGAAHGGKPCEIVMFTGVRYSRGDQAQTAKKRKTVKAKIIPVKRDENLT